MQPPENKVMPSCVMCLFSSVLQRPRTLEPQKVPRGVKTCSSQGRALQYPDDLYVLDGVLFCKYCAHSLVADKADTVKGHLASVKHLEAKRKGVTVRQGVINNDADGSRKLIIHDFLRMMCAADVPLNKVEKFLPFLRKHCVEGGFVPGQTQLRKTYLPLVCILLHLISHHPLHCL